MACSKPRQQIVIRYPLLLGGNERLEAGGDPEAQFTEERWLWLRVKLYLYAGLIGRLIWGEGWGNTAHIIIEIKAGATVKWSTSWRPTTKTIGCHSAILFLQSPELETHFSSNHCRSVSWNLVKWSLYLPGLESQPPTKTEIHVTEANEKSWNHKLLVQLLLLGEQCPCT